MLINCHILPMLSIKTICIDTVVVMIVW